MMSATTGPAEQRFTNLQARTVAFCFVLNMLNGADVLVTSYVAPLLKTQWQVGDQTLGLVFSAGLAGMMLGALALAPLSDIFGRKIMILCASVMIATGMAASSLATNVGELIALRFWTGLGIGSMLASVTSMASEYAPARFRSLAVMIAASGFPLGSTAMSFAANASLPIYGWPILFLAAGALSAAMVPICLTWMPESVEFLLARRPPNALAKVNRILTARGEALLESLPPRDGAIAQPSPRQLLTSTHRRDTLFVWAAFFAAFMTLYFLLSWIPTLAVDAGLSIKHAIYAGAAYHVGSIVGHVLLGWLSLRMSLIALIAGPFLLAALLMPVIGAVHQPVALFLVEIFALGLLAQGAFGGLYAAAARLYPTEIRTTGVGWALGVGRLGAVLGPFLGGLALAWGAGPFGSFVMFAIPLIVAGLAAAKLGSGPAQDQSAAPLADRELSA